MRWSNTSVPHGLGPSLDALALGFQGFMVLGAGFQVLGCKVSVDEVARSGVKHAESLARFALDTHP